MMCVTALCRCASRAAHVTAAALILGGAARAIDAPIAHAQASTQGQGHLVIISGLPGEDRFARDYLEWGGDLARAAVERFGMPQANVIWLADDAAAHPLIRGRSTRENVERELGGLSARAGANDRVLIVVFGHGSYQAGESRINLPGPDMNSVQLAGVLEAFGSRRVAVVNATSASGGFVKDLAAPNRIVITATKSGMEANETLFGGHFAAALTGDAADTDKDGRVSLLEAFEYARLEVEREYSSTNRLQTEHAVVDGVGDGTGVGTLADGGPHASAAAAFHLGSAAAGAANATPELRALYEEKARIEEALAVLRARREMMPAAEYDTALERLLVRLAENGSAIRRAEGGGS